MYVVQEVTHPISPSLVTDAHTRAVPSSEPLTNTDCGLRVSHNGGSVIFVKPNMRMLFVCTEVCLG